MAVEGGDPAVTDYLVQLLKVRERVSGQYKDNIARGLISAETHASLAAYADGLNLYAYVGNDPVNATDPSGLYASGCASSRLSSTCERNGFPLDNGYSGGGAGSGGGEGSGGGRAGGGGTPNVCIDGACTPQIGFIPGSSSGSDTGDEIVVTATRSRTYEYWNATGTFRLWNTFGGDAVFGNDLGISCFNATCSDGINDATLDVLSVLPIFRSARVAGGAAGARIVGATGFFFGQSFKSFSAFKRAFGAAGQGKNWHHIVEQTPGNIARFGASRVHNTINLRVVDATVHARISGYYSSIQPAVTGSQNVTVRQWLGTQSFRTQYEFGLSVLRQAGGG